MPAASDGWHPRISRAKHREREAKEVEMTPTRDPKTTCARAGAKEREGGVKEFENKRLFCSPSSRRLQNKCSSERSQRHCTKVMAILGRDSCPPAWPRAQEPTDFIGTTMTVGEYQQSVEEWVRWTLPACIRSVPSDRTNPNPKPVAFGFTGIPHGGRTASHVAVVDFCTEWRNDGTGGRICARIII